jgi:hypothetical protein
VEVEKEERYRRVSTTHRDFIGRAPYKKIPPKVRSDKNALAGSRGPNAFHDLNRINEPVRLCAATVQRT